ncbi:hypothetical protein [Edaphobacter aggregans]|uniref:hypothetical protein n=1 Tax=Edaphobacter aggregans TaxID=570835 RepID=UPI000F738FF5|nr:hypothetical protein [Edaphobacter aggregans]
MPTSFPQTGRLTFAERSAAKKSIRVTTPSHPDTAGFLIFAQSYRAKAGIRATARAVFADPTTRCRCRR